MQHHTNLVRSLQLMATKKLTYQGCIGRKRPSWIAALHRFAVTTAVLSPHLIDTMVTSTVAASNKLTNLNTLSAVDLRILLQPRHFVQTTDIEEES